MITATDIVTQAQETDTFLEEMRVLHKRRLRRSIRALENKMINQLAHLDVTKAGKLEGIKVNLKQSQKIHAKMLVLFEEEYGQTVNSVIGDYGQIATHIKRSWRSLGESVHFTDVDKAMLASLQEQSFSQFAQFGDLAKTRMADAMYSSVVAGASYAQLVKTVQGILRGHKDIRGRSMVTHADTYAFDSVMNFHNQVNMKKADDLGIKKFMYVGDIIGTTRQFCRTRAGKLYTRAQIESWNRLSWTGKSGPALTHRGGYNCRHHWRAFKDEWLNEAEEAQDMIEEAIIPETEQMAGIKAKMAEEQVVYNKAKGGFTALNKERDGLRAKIAAAGSKASAAPFKARITAIRKEIIARQKEMRESKVMLKGLKDELRAARQRARSITPPVKPKVIKPKVVKPVVEPVIVKPPPLTPAPASGDIAVLEGKIKGMQVELKRLNLEHTVKGKLRTAKVRETYGLRQELEALELAGGSKAKINALKKVIKEGEAEYILMRHERDKVYNAMNALRAEIKIQKRVLALQQVIAPEVGVVRKVVGDSDALMGNYLKAQKELDAFVKGSSDILNRGLDDWVDLSYQMQFPGPYRKLYEEAHRLHTKVFESKMGWYRSLPNDLKGKQRVGVIEQIMRDNLVGKGCFKSLSRGTDHLSYRMLSELQRNKIRINWYSDYGRASYRGGGVNFFRGDNYTVVAHEVAHAIDALMSTGFKGFGHTGFVWKNDCPYIAKMARDKLRKAYAKHHKLKRGTYHNGDGQYWENNWIDDYEGRIYIRDMHNVGTTSEAIINKMPVAQEWWSMNVERYSGVMRAGRRKYDEQVRYIKERLEFHEGQVAKYGRDQSVLSNLKKQAADLNAVGPGGFMKKELNESPKWLRVRRMYPDLADFIEDFFGSLTAT